jgi:hypothetical protein
MADVPQKIVAPSSVQWFAAEFLVVMTGVLVALAVDAWWEKQTELRLEQTYLEQIAIDLEEALAEVRANDRRMDANDERTAAVVSAFRSPNSISADSLYTLIPGLMGWGDAQQVRTATMEAVVANGDLSLIRSDELRSSIPGFVETVREEMMDRRSDLEINRAAIQLLLEDVDYLEALIRRRQDRDSAYVVRGNVLAPAAPRRIPLSLDTRSFFSDLQLYRGVLSIWVMRNKDAVRRTRLEEALEEQLALVHTALGR